MFLNQFLMDSWKKINLKIAYGTFKWNVYGKEGN